MLMDPARLIPAAEAIPSPWGWFEALLILTFALHMLFMNLSVGSAVIAFFGRLTGRQADLAHELGHRLPTFLALTINFGVAPLLFVQVLYGQFLYTSSVLMAGWWLSAIGAVIIGYYGLYAHNAAFDAHPGLSRLALFVSLAFLLYTGFLLSNNMTLMLRPEAWTAYLDNPRGSLLNLSDATLWPRYVHAILAAPAVAGLYAALLGEKKRRPDWVAHGLLWFTRLTMAQVLVGGWLLMALPRPVLLGFMGRDLLATGILAAGTLTGLAALMAGLRKRTMLTVGLTVLTVLLMAVTRGQVRLLTLAPYFSPASLPVTGEVSPLLMFVIALIAGLAAIAYMLKVYAKTAPKTTGRG
jgi:ABC-type cobalt transport system substrate-binding protein